MAKYKYDKTFTFEGVRYRIRANSKKEFDEKYRAKLKSLEENRYTKKCDLTMNEFYERWEADRFGTVKEATIYLQHKWYKDISNSPIDGNGRKFGTLRVREVEDDNIKTLRIYLLSLKRSDRYSNSSVPDKRLYNTQVVNNMIGFISHLFNDAIEQKIITDNPCKTVKKLKKSSADVQARKTIHRALSNEEIELFLNAIKGTWYENHILFMLNSGVRCGELASLRLSDIDFKNKVIHIERTVSKSMSGTWVISDTPKTEESKRDIPLNKAMENALRNQRELNKNMFGENIERIYPDTDNSSSSYIQRRKAELDSLIFKSPENRLLSTSSFDAFIKRTCQQIGIDHFSSHAFRDTFATQAIINGVHPNTLKEILGHTSYSMTMDLYAHVMEDTKKNEMELVKIGIG